MRNPSLHAPALTPGYKISLLRSPRNALIAIKRGSTEFSAPVFAASELGPKDDDLILNFAHGGLPVGERIVMHVEWESSRRATLVAQREDRQGERVYRFDIHVQGPTPAEETVFFDV